MFEMIMQFPRKLNIEVTRNSEWDFFQNGGSILKEFGSAYIVLNFAL